MGHNCGHSSLQSAEAVEEEKRPKHADAKALPNAPSVK